MKYNRNLSFQVYPEVMHVLCQVWIGKGHDRKEEIKEE